MFNGYNETPLISYNEFNQERAEKKQENVPKWSYGHDAGAQPAQPHTNNRHSEFWSGKPNFIGIPNVLKCSCAGCYPSSESQSYQGESTRHRPWLPRTFSVPLNGSNEPCKLPTYQWDNGFSNQGPCYSEGNLPYAQDTGGKYSYYRHYQGSRLPEPNQPGVITSVKNGEYPKKPRNEVPSPVQNGVRQPVLCNSACNLSKRVDGRNYCGPNEKYSNVASYSVDQQVSRLPVVEPFIKAVPSNLSQNRVPSTGYRAVKESLPQQYIGSGYGDARKIPEPAVNGDKRCESFPGAQPQTGLHVDYSYLNRDVPEVEPQKLFFDNTRHPDYYSKNNFQDVMKRNGQMADGRKDCAINQIGQTNTTEQHYNMPRTKYQEHAGSKPSYEVFYTKDFEKSRQDAQDDTGCFQRNEDAETEHARLPRSALLFNDLHFADRTQNSFPYQSNQTGCGSYFRSEYQGYNAQPRYRYPTTFQRNDVNQYRAMPQQQQTCEQVQHGNGFVYDIHCQQNVDKTQQFYGGKNQSVQSDAQPAENGKPTYLEAIRSEEITKNGTSKISPLRLLRKKKFINVPQESTRASTFDAAPGLDVRKFWSTWAEEEEENVAPAQMVVLDCQNIDPEQAKLLHLYETDPARAVHLETGSIVIKNAGCVKEEVGQTVDLEEIKASEQLTGEQRTQEEASAKNEIRIPQEGENEKEEESCSESEKKSGVVDSVCQKMSPGRSFKKEKPEDGRGRKKTEIMDKWTEKKFDFLKRAEESKAAEIIRHEEEKKKIFETRLSLQQSLKKAEKTHSAAEGSAPERTSPFDENSQSNSPEDSSTSGLPTSEYRRNKFLDYSERNIIVNGKDEAERGAGGDRSEPAEEPTKVDDIKKENVKSDCPNKWAERQSTGRLSPSFKTKFKEEPPFEMDQILRKMSEINFQNAETKISENSAKKPKLNARKWKRKKSDHQQENEDRTDKLMVETVTKPTIKFSIQKSHDLKISFKVLNSSNEYEDLGGGHAEADGNPNEDSKNSTELITLKYKSIQRDGDRKQGSGLKKIRRAFRRKKQICRAKSPVIGSKESGEEPQEERDPLADDSESSNIPNADEYAISDGFQVKETVDSAKIKLTFKRHKGNFETEYKINSNNLEKVSEHDPLREDDASARHRKKSRARRNEIFSEPDVESFQGYSEATADVDSEPEIQKVFLESTVEDSINSSTSQDSFAEKENFELEPSSFSEFPSDAHAAGQTPEKVSPCGFTPPGAGEGRYATEGSKSNGETNKCRQEHEEFGVNHLINCEEEDGSEGKGEEFLLSDCNAFPDVSLNGPTPERPPSPEEGLKKGTDMEKEEIQEISLDFIKSTKSQEIETNHKSRKTEETENVEEGAGAVDREKRGLESPRKLQETSHDAGDGENALAKISGNWEVGPGSADDGPKTPENTPIFRSCLEDENGKSLTPADREHGQISEEADEILLLSPKIAQTVERDAGGVADCENEDAPEPGLGEGSDFDLSSTNSTGDSREDSKCDVPPLETSFLPSEGSGLLAASVDDEKVEEEEEKETSSELQECSTQSQSEEVDPLSFDLPSENPPKCDATESCSPSKTQTMELTEADFSLPEKIGFESPEISFEDDRFLLAGVSARPEDGTKDGDSGVLVGPFTSPGQSPPKESRDTDLDQADPEDHQPGRKDANERVDEWAKPEAINFTNSPNGCDSGPPEPLGNDSGCAEFSFSPHGTKDKQEVSPAPKDSTEDADLSDELEEGEVVDSSDECSPVKTPNAGIGVTKKAEFVVREVERRHSTDSKKPELQTWSRRKFSKAKSCLPEVKYSEGQSQEEAIISVKDIPLPVGPPPLGSCPYFKKHAGSNESPPNAEANKSRRESISKERALACQKLSESQSHQPPFSSNDLENCRNPSPPRQEADKQPSSCSGIFQRSTKIKFSFSKRSKFSKIGLNKTRDSKIETAFNMSESKVREEPKKREVEGEDFEKKKPGTPEPERRSPTPTECKIEVPNVAKGKEERKGSGGEEPKPGSHSEHPVELLCEGLGETVEVMSDFIRDEFYECEDLPTSEDLTNGDDLELEKVNDDKFRNIMQNCIDNAKKFLNIGNLKLFSCSVDDLLELDCRSEAAAGENDPEKSAHHISRDVLLTSCDDAGDDLGFPENRQTGDLSMDFVPSFSSDVCPEILPVDNWPYLEEEVPSSPKQDDTELIPPLENVSTLQEGSPHELLAAEAGFKTFRRRSVMSEEAFKLSSAMGTRRRNTIDCFTGESFDIKNEIMRLKRGTDEFEKKSLKCRLSLKKLSNSEPKDGRTRELSEELQNGVKAKSAKGVDYKSPSWQPKVMLFRISKNELRKVLKSSKTCKRFRSEKSEGSLPAEPSGDSQSEGESALKKWKSDFDSETLFPGPEKEIEKVTETMSAEGADNGMPISLPRLGPSLIKGSLRSTDPNKKKKKSRFRNLHTKRKSDSAEDTAPPKEAKVPDDAEALLAEMFKDCDRTTHSQDKYPKERTHGREDEEKPRKKPSETKPENSSRLSSGIGKTDAEASRSCGKVRDESKEAKHRDKSEKRHDHRDRRRERGDGKEERRQRDKHEESDSKRHSKHGHDRSRHSDRSSSGGIRHVGQHRKDLGKVRSAEGEEKKPKGQKEGSPEPPWACEVCGFNDTSERIVHIKSHPFHCQSCHLAFKTEAHFISHLTKKHKDIRNQHHCLLCELSFDTEVQYQKHLDTREHRHLEAVEKNTINTLFTLLTGAPCPVLGIVDMKPEWLPNQAGTVHFYHQATPLSLALQYLKMRHDLSSFSAASSAHPG